MEEFSSVCFVGWLQPNNFHRFFVGWLQAWLMKETIMP
jgi:hypothetical protein